MQTPLETLQVLFGDWSVAPRTALLAALLTYLCTPVVRWLARRTGAIDCPGGRRVHTVATPRLGGIAVLIGVLASALFGYFSLTAGHGTDLPLTPGLESAAYLPAILWIATLVCLVGAIDDLVGISPLGKVLGLTIAALMLCANGVIIEMVNLPGIGRIELGWLAIPATVVWVLACTNAVNLIDGADGVGPGVIMIAACALMLMALGLGDPVSALLFGATGGAAFGFLIHNRQPASIFLGDSGSLLLGFLVAAIAAAGSTKAATAATLVGALVALAVPFLDAVQSFLRRFRAALRQPGPRRLGRALRATTIADHGHIHHRLLLGGMSHNGVALVLCLVTTITSLTILLFLPGGVYWGATIATALVASFVLYRLGSVRQDANHNTAPSPVHHQPAIDPPPPSGGPQGMGRPQPARRATRNPTQQA